MMIESMESRRLMSGSSFTLPEVGDEVLLTTTVLTQPTTPLRQRVQRLEAENGGLDTTDEAPLFWRMAGSTTDTANALVSDSDETSDADESAEEDIEEALSGSQPSAPTAPVDPK
jgi:hypothetical protein